jgi:hypothetical protein
MCYADSGTFNIATQHDPARCVLTRTRTRLVTREPNCLSMDKLLNLPTVWGKFNIKDVLKQGLLGYDAVLSSLVP